VKPRPPGHAAPLLVEMKKQNVPAELHVYPEGGHGYALRQHRPPVGEWPKLCEQWMKRRGLLSRGKQEE
jgi:dipeptidyl aminopeptidase/acylaminoacyl peptidase